MMTSDLRRREKRNIFARTIWTTQITLNWLSKFVFRRSAFCGIPIAVPRNQRAKALLIFPQGGHQG